jgi:hypothetical protein
MPSRGFGRLVAHSVPRVPDGAAAVVTGVVELHDPPGVRLLAQLDVRPEEAVSDMELELAWSEGEGQFTPHFVPLTQGDPT